MNKPNQKNQEPDELPEDFIGTEDELQDEEAQEGASWLQNMPAWALSAVLHLILIILFMNIVSKEERKKEKEVPITVQVAAPAPMKQKPPAYDPNAKRSTQKTPKVPGPKELSDKPIKLKKEVDEVAADIPQGTSLENITNFNTDFSGSGNATGTNISMGVGGGVAGAYGERWGRGSFSKEGGSEGTEDAVRAALEWLRRHQSADGSWKCHDFSEACKKPCVNTNTKYGDGRGWKDRDVGVTGLAMLAFAGYGHTHRDGLHEEYVQCLSKAVEYLRSHQDRSGDPNTNGRYGAGTGEQWIYDHAIATMAMAELLAMSSDVVLLKRSVTDAVNLCLHAQNPGYGWKYDVKPGKNDTSVTGWMVLALKTAKNCRLEIPKERIEESIKGALTWIDRATSVSSGKTGYESPGDEGSALKGEYPEPYPYSKELSCMTAVGVLCRLFAGQSRGDPVIKRGIDIIMKEPPQWVEQKGPQLSKINVYYWYYGSYAMFQFGGKPWKDWNEEMQKALLSSQRQGADLCEDGSWDPIDEWGKAGGRVYSTALGAMTLEVYYRFRRAQQGVGL